MGSTAGAFMSGLMGVLEPRIEKRHQEEEDKRKELRQFYLKSLADPNVSDAAREEAQNQLQKLLHPEAKKGFAKIAPMLGQVVGLHRNQQQRQPMDERLPDGRSVQEASEGGLARRARAVMQGPDLASIYKGYGVDADKRAAQSKLDLEDQEFQAWMKRGKEVLGDDANPRDLAEYAGSKGARLPAQAKRIADKGVARPGEDPATGKPYEGLWDHTVDPDGTETWAKRPDTKAGGSERQGRPLSVEDAIKLEENGVMEFNNRDGEKIDLHSYPPGMGLFPVLGGKNGPYYLPLTPGQRTVDVGNRKYAVTPWEIKGITSGSGTDLGPVRTGQSSIAPATVFNPDTRQFQQLPGATTPNTPGATGRPATPNAPASAPRAPKAGGPTAQARPAAAPIGGRSLGDTIPAGQVTATANRATPVIEATTQIFGNPDQPDLKSLKDYASLANDKASQKRLGEAFKIFDMMDQATHGGTISAGAGPISISTGGVGEVLQNYFGVPQQIASQIADRQREAMSNLTPQEREYFNSVMDSFSTVVGLRSLTRASAAQSSVRALQNDIPVIGVNTFDQASFADKLQRLAGYVYTGMETGMVPQGAVSPKMRERIKNLGSEMQKIKQSSPASAPKVTPKVGAVENGYRFKGGDPAKQESWEPVSASKR